MLTSITTIIISAIIGFLEGPSLLKKKLKLESWIFFTILLIGTLLSILLELRVKLPNPLDLITYIYKPISDYVFGILK
ncbi:hypothetical protein GCM10008018_11790 [Paenibacillus marchantiophytorum]|uniref:Uncharacterized protein n=1 Tax=Paenibacillus marchantiophytorum TaxID=1619310 RepID=A0ABQ2BQT6_9BACL|nr:hypothetical protein [Paenibacillus marchantiophytorum]GGI45380.1 hypothetical protein GCM10008018_11790 [Paenibacillus marchantiophytorum]